jgi:hypothetical protein
MSTEPKYKSSETVTINRSQVNFAPYNPRKKSAKVVAELKRNFKKVGFLGGIVWNDVTGNLISGHKRTETLDLIHDYDGTPETDYQIKVEKVSIDEKTEKEQNIFMNNSSVQGEYDMDMLKDLLPDIDTRAAGFNDHDLNIIGVHEAFELETDNIADELADLGRPAAEKKQAIKDLKKQIREKADDKFEDGDPYIMLSFDNFKNKAAFMRRFDFNQHDKIVKGEVFSEMVERID